MGGDNNDKAARDVKGKVEKRRRKGGKITKQREKGRGKVLYRDRDGRDQRASGGAISYSSRKE